LIGDGWNMRLVSGIIIALCVTFPVAALMLKEPAPGDATAQAPGQGSNPSPAETPAKKDAPINPQTPGAEKDASGAPQPDAKSEPKAEPPSEPKAEPKIQPNAEPATEPQPGVKAEPKTEPETERKSEPKTEPSGEPKAEEKTEPKKKADVEVPSANAKRGVGKRAAMETGQASSLSVPEGTPRKTVVRQGGVDEPKAQIVTGMTPEEASRQRQRAEQSLTTTVETLERIDPQVLSAQQQETVSQIHNYMEGARSALKEGDISRAHTLAMKAALLAEDLAKH